MGIDVIKLNENDNREGVMQPSISAQDLAQISFSLHSVPSPAMSIWLMVLPAGQPVFPWWSYGSAIDEDINKLASLTGIASPQGLFDYLFLVAMKKSFSNGLYALVPGNVRTEGWSNLNEPARAAFQRGQNCVYRLEASLGKKMSVNWVPFYQPQCMVKDASGDNLTRFFNAAKTDDVATSMSFISMDDVRKMPEIVNLLVQQDDKRSEKMAQLADWFGVYSSPLDDKHGTCALVYTTKKESAAALVAFQKQFSAAIDTVRKALIAEPSPNTVLRLLSRLIAL